MSKKIQSKQRLIQIIVSVPGATHEFFRVVDAKSSSIFHKNRASVSLRQPRLLQVILRKLLRLIEVKFGQRKIVRIVRHVKKEYRYVVWFFRKHIFVENYDLDQGFLC
ncbi:hypothetical protein P792_08855 [Asaia sp. SF2.1]|nr:hypothetical protein P792_08855 [Asaia sp. SF2.1]